mgnify:CR=1 FL=1
MIDDKVFSLIKEGSYSTNVNLCGKCSERLNPCRNMGKCLDAPTQLGFVCLCPEAQRGEVSKKLKNGRRIFFSLRNFPFSLSLI